ncbi:URC4/urg3 family protein [Polaromonas sp. C04]|uniref:URC4/urg3 family protein n=1 Tax=Polaromonas sp. C04 TaxID=1945857 RepID=UPI000984F373|nr:URC4/urg3 family protein [Polaromonas sp. C04]OOG57605.1 uracil phosphoribosyltransferase [Polaromonas sp. C04]
MKDIVLIADSADATRAAALLRSTDTIRTRARGLLARARAGESVYFTVHNDALAEAAALVAEVTRERYPDLIIPYHSRWRHFEAGGLDRVALLNEALGKVSPPRRARAQIDLAVVSVLLDAGAGPDWHYLDPRSGQRLTRSEGLGVASFNAFRKGLFSSKPTQRCQADAPGLMALTARQLGAAFQVGVDNPMVGLDGRAALLRRLGEVIAEQPEIFGGAGGLCRPGRLFDYLTAPEQTGSNDEATDGATTVPASRILSTLLTALAPIWPGHNAIEKIALGDCWRHSAVRGEGLSDGWMPFHKLSQWLTYSLLEPFEWAGVTVTGLDALTGLPEYRNGGLLLDAGVLRLKDAALATQTHRAGDELIVEWRALTVALLDELAPLVREQLGLSESQMPLACVLEGGTWAAGRVLAQRQRGGAPPLAIESDGTVF